MRPTTYMSLAASKTDQAETLITEAPDHLSSAGDIATIFDAEREVLTRALAALKGVARHIADTTEAIEKRSRNTSILDTAPLLTVISHRSRLAFLDQNARLDYLTAGHDVVTPDGRRAYVVDILSPTTAVVGWYDDNGGHDSTVNVVGWTVDYY